MDSRLASSDPITRKRRRKSKKFQSQIARIWREWWVEILIVVLVLLAIFLLVERMNIRESLYAGLLSLVDGLTAAVSRLAHGLVGLVQRTTLSDLTAYVLLAMVAALLVWRARQRLLNNAELGGTRCPGCGSELRRTHRRWHDRLVNILVPVRRYRCRNRECGWYGLRVHKNG